MRWTDPLSSSPRRSPWRSEHTLVAILCLIGFIVSGLIADLVFEQVPHIEDEVAYFFQAQVFAGGHLYARAPFHANCFFAPFVLDHQGRRFGKYPPGWPALLAVGVRLGQPWWVNAACTALIIALTFRLGQEMLPRRVGLWAAALAVASPFLLLLSGSLMSHVACLLCLTAFLWCFRRSCAGAGAVTSLWPWAAGLALGGGFAIRPFTAVSLGLPAILYAVWRWLRYGEWRRVWLMAWGFIPLALTVPLFNAIWTGDPLLSPYVLFWPYDRLGFGPGHGPTPQGNTIWLGLGETLLGLGRLANHLHGWPSLSLAAIILGFLGKPRRFWPVFCLLSALSLILGYALYWTQGDLFGPRYYAEAMSLLFILSADGMAQIAAWVRRRGLWYQHAWRLGLGLLIAIDLLVYLPIQFSRYHGLFGITAGPKTLLQQAHLEQGLVIVRHSAHDPHGWKDYAVAFTLNTPNLDGHVVYASDCGPLIPTLLQAFPQRPVYEFDGHTLRLWPAIP